MTSRPVRIAGSAMTPRSSSERKSVMFCSKRVPASDETSIRKSWPSQTSNGVQLSRERGPHIGKSALVPARVWAEMARRRRRPSLANVAGARAEKLGRLTRISAGPITRDVRSPRRSFAVADDPLVVAYASGLRTRRRKYMHILCRRFRSMPSSERRVVHAKAKPVWHQPRRADPRDLGAAEPTVYVAVSRGRPSPAGPPRGGGRRQRRIATPLDTRRDVVSKWRKRCFEEGLAGPEERPRRGRPVGFTSPQPGG